MKIVDKLYMWYGKTVVRAIFFVLVALALYLVFFSGSSKKEDVETAVKIPSVIVSSASSQNGGSSFTAVGTLLAVTEAKLQTESGGRIVAVNTELGATVRAGSIIARLEGASESAQLLQAQGAYEAALAGAQASGVSVEGALTSLSSAQTSGITTFQNTYITVDSVLHNDIDDLFTISNGVATGFKLDGGGQATTLNAERTALENVIQRWAEKKNTVSKDQISKELKDARTDVLRVVSLVDTLNTLVINQDTNESFTEVEKKALQAQLQGVRVALNGALQQIERASIAIDGAAKGLEQAQIAGSSVMPSASSAQVKIALGSLRGAQANYEKTLVRTPISGVVNALYLKAGEYAQPSTAAAIIANNNGGLEVSTSISQEESVLIEVGDEVSVNKVATGTVAAIGGSIDPTTGKVAVKISVDENLALQNGSTVSITFVTKAKDPSVQTEINIPLSAIKMTGSGPIVFTVDSQTNILKANPVTLGNIKGDVVVVTEGITGDTMIVQDGRGLKEGTEVTVEIK